MKEIKKCSISGVAFTLDTDAYETLDTYLESLKKAYKDSSDGAEIVADIEARIAELILSTQSNERVVEKPLIMNIIRQMGSAEDISQEQTDKDLHDASPRIPRRLYRDTENARLGGVCAGIGRYFDIDPVWVRLALFMPPLLGMLGWIPVINWFGPMFSNLFGILFICYFIMWFAVPAARSARQKLEMNGERITAQTISEVTSASSIAHEGEDRARSAVAEAVAFLSKLVLIFLKVFAGSIVLTLIAFACALIIGLLAVLVGGNTSVIIPSILDISVSVWISLLGILVLLIPTILLIYVLMCLIASRKPGHRSTLVIFLLWLTSIIALTTLAIHENVGEKFRSKRNAFERIFQDKLIIDGDTTTLERLLKEYEDESVVREGRKRLHISVPSKSIDISVDKHQGKVEIKADGKELRVQTKTPQTPSETDRTENQTDPAQKAS